METFIKNLWNKNKAFIKGLVIAFLVLLLLIPTQFVESLIAEREQRQKEAIKEVSSKWAGKQIITGPVLVLPYREIAADTTVNQTVNKQYAYFLPDELSINGKMTPQERSRGIYKVMLYTSQMDINGSFQNIALEKLKLSADNILWNEAFVKLFVSDTKGLDEEVKLKWNDSLLTLTSQEIDGAISENGLIAQLPLTGAGDLKNVHFSARLSISGSEQVAFSPIGKTTNVSLQSQWPHPSFMGNILPQTSEVKDNGFAAVWKSLAHKRAFPQQWKSSDANDNYTASKTFSKIAEASFGVNLFIPVNDYQRTMRSVKYAILCILLTFAGFFIMDTMYKKGVHPFQYGLIGLALVLFYVLLLSFSEYTGFNVAYVIASAATIGLIGWFVKGVLLSGRLSTILSVILLFIYTYVFTILQLQDYALLLGSIGLFLTLAVIMHFSRKVQW